MTELGGIQSAAISMNGASSERLATFEDKENQMQPVFNSKGIRRKAREDSEYGSRTSMKM